MLINFITFILISAYGLVVSDIQTMIIAVCAYILGVSITRWVDKRDTVSATNIYRTLFNAGLLYCILSFSYMQSNSYEWLLAFDTHNYFLPRTEMFISENTFADAISSIWSNFYIFQKFQAGYFTYTTIWGWIAKLRGAELYLVLNFSTIFLYSFVGVVIFKLFKICEFTVKDSKRNAIIISLLSAVFYYSFLTMRDIPVMLTYLLAIYVTLKPGFSMWSIVKLIALIFITATLRIESAIFLLTSIPTYLLIALTNKRDRMWVIFISSIAGGVGLVLLAMNYDTINAIINANDEHYTEDLGGGVIATLQRIPVAGDIASIIYNALQPIPFWRNFTPIDGGKYGGEMYNPMRITESIGGVFNLWTIICVFVFIFSKKLKKQVRKVLSKPFVYQLWVGFAFLYLQSAVIAQRRLMAYYCIYYILAFIIYGQMTRKQRFEITGISILIFISLQIFGHIYLM